MATTPTIFIQTKYAENVATQQYTPGNDIALVDKFTVANQNSVAVTLSVHIVASGGTPSNANRIIPVRSIAAGATSCLFEMVGQILNSGQSIWTTASAPSSLVIRCCGRQIT